MKKQDIKQLFVAIRKHDNKTARNLLKEDPDLLNAHASAPPKQDDGQSVLQVAFKTGNLNMAKHLIELGADIHFMEKSTVNEWTAPVLHDALRAAVFTTQDGRSDDALWLVRKLLKMGVDPNTADSFGNTPLLRVLADARQLLSKESEFPSRVRNTALNRSLQKVVGVLLEAGGRHQCGQPVRRVCAGNGKGAGNRTTLAKANAEQSDAPYSQLATLVENR
jgi:hypothetical protein